MTTRRAASRSWLTCSVEAALIRPALPLDASPLAMGAPTVSYGPPAAGGRSSGGRGLGRQRSHVSRGGPDEAAGAALLAEVGAPAAGAGHREGRGEERAREAHGVEEERGVELDVGPQGPAGM